MNKTSQIHTFDGHVGQDPEFRFTPSGKPVATFNVAVVTYQGRDKKERTDWHRVVAWDQKAEYANEYIRKGMLVHCETRFQSGSYQDREDITRYTAEFIIKGDGDSLQILSERRDEDWEEEDRPRRSRPSRDEEEPRDTRRTAPRRTRSTEREPDDGYTRPGEAAPRRGRPDTRMDRLESMILSLTKKLTTPQGENESSPETEEPAEEEQPLMTEGQVPF